MDVARLYSDPTYYPLHRRFLELQARNPEGFAEGTADAALAQDLQRRMDERSAALGLAPPAADEGGDSGAEPFPPAAPAPAEAVVPVGADPVVQRRAYRPLDMGDGSIAALPGRAAP